MKLVWRLSKLVMKGMMMKLFEHHPWLALALCFLAYAIVSTMDYEDARRDECARQNLSYNSQKDTCE